MNTDYTYCKNTSCIIKEQCKRYLKESPDIPLWYVTGENENCEYFEQK